MALTYRKKEKIRKAIIDEKGITFYNSRDHIINSILYSELESSETSSDDAYIYNTTGKYAKTYLKVYLKNKTGEIVMTTIDFNFEYIVLSNQFEMYRQFLRGIQCFRTDLKIRPQTIKEYNLTPDFPPVKGYEKFEFIISAFLLLACFGLIYALILLMSTFF